MAIVSHSLKSGPFVSGLKAPIEDPRYGGMSGWQGDIKDYLSQYPYTSGQIIYMMLRGPTGPSLLNDGGLIVGSIKSLLEVGSHRIEGIRRSLQPTVEGYAVGGGGQEYHYPTDLKEDQSEPTHTMYDRLNGCVSRLWEYYYRMFIMDQKTKAPGIISLGIRPEKILPDFYSWVGIYIEPDITQTKCVDAIMIVNQFPKTMPTIEHRRDMTAGREIREISITLAGMQDTSFGTLAIGQMLLDRINYTGSNPQMQNAPLDDIDADIKRHPGYMDGIDAMSKTAIAP